MAIGDKFKDLLGLGKERSFDASDIPYPPPEPDTNDAGAAYSVKIIIKNQIRNGEKFSNENIVARLPESFRMSVESRWDDVVSSQNDSSLFKIANLTAQELFNTHLKSQIFTSQMWSGNSPLEFTLPLQFKAFRDAREEVVNPIKALIKAALPSLTGGINELFLSPPGPKLLQDWAPTKFVQQNLSTKSVDKGVSLMIGRFLYFQGLIISNVDCDFKTIMSFENLPMSADCEVTFRTVKAYTVEDIEEIFKGPPINRKV